MAFVKHPLDLIGRRLAMVAAKMLEDSEVKFVSDSNRKGLSWHSELPRRLSPSMRRQMRYALAVCFAVASFVLMLADIVSDGLVLKELNVLRLGEDIGKEVLDLETLFNATGRRTLVDYGLELAAATDASGKVAGTKRQDKLLAICSALRDFIASGNCQCIAGIRETYETVQIGRYTYFSYQQVDTMKKTMLFYFLYSCKFKICIINTHIPWDRRAKGIFTHRGFLVL